MARPMTPDDKIEEEARECWNMAADAFPELSRWEDLDEPTKAKQREAVRWAMHTYRRTIH
jgi:hypothetical protein